MKFLRFLEGFFFGALLGAAAAILLAPSSGEELRNRLQSEAERIRAEVSEAANARRIDLEQQLATLRSPGKPATE